MIARPRLAARIHGDPHAPWLVLLHGFLGSHHDWETVLPHLPRKYACLCVDLPGHGSSPIAPPGSPGEIVQALATLLDEHHIERFALAGYSMGGRVALALAAHIPARVDRLILESTSPGLHDTDERTTRRALDARWIEMLESGPIETFIDRWYDQPLFQTIRRDPIRFDALRNGRLTQNPHRLAQALQIMGPGTWPSQWDAWRGLALPTLLMAGEEDAKYVAMAGEMQRKRGNAQMAIIPGCGHNVHWESPQAYGHAVSLFLTGNN